MTITHELSVTVSVPDGAFDGDQPLVAVMRGPYVGSLHRGTLAVVDADGGSRLALGNVSQRVFMRSAAKPFQVMPAVLSGAIDRFGITEREFAVLCASHSAEPYHMEAVLSILSKIGLDESALRCGVHPPIDEATAESMVRAGTEPSPVCNNCSGAHAGMLAACVASGWPIDSYGSPNHPLQHETRRILAQFAGIAPEEVEFAIDNCHVPAFRLPLDRAATAFARIAAGSHVDGNLRQAAGRVVAAMTAFPEMVGGRNRFDTDLMRVTGGSLVCKGGAEAFQGLGLVGAGMGVALKISDGNARAIPPAVVPLLQHLGSLSVDQVAQLDVYAHPRVFDHRDELVGQLVPTISFGGLS